MNKAETGHKAPLGLRTIALFELVKGLVWVALGICCLTLMHKDVHAVLADLFHHYLHVDPAWAGTRLCIDTASKLTDSQLRMISLIALVCSVARFVEAYGLWHECHWAEWFAVLSAGLFLPVEVYHMAHHFNSFKLSVFLVNIVVVWYLLRVLVNEHNRRKAALAPPPAVAAAAPKLAVLKDATEMVSRADRA